MVYRILTGKTLELPEDETSLTDMTDTEINALLEVDIGGSAKHSDTVKVGRIFNPVLRIQGFYIIIINEMAIFQFSCLSLKCNFELRNTLYLIKDPPF